MKFSRRAWVRTASTAAAGVAVGLPQHAPLLAADSPPAPFQLPPLDYPFAALEPAIDARTMEIHHGKHHAAYVKNLNDALAKTPALSGKPLEELLRKPDALPEPVRAAIRNNGGGHANHSLFWKTIGPGGGGEPGGPLGDAIRSAFGDFAGFRDRFAKAASGVFGSGWAWLALDGREAVILSTPNQDSPLALGLTPLLGLDVWEHAYYLQYQNRRADYIAAFFGVIRWEAVAAGLPA